MSEMYTAVASREGRWWLIKVDGIGATQAARAAEVREQARDLIAAVLDRPVDEVHVTVDFVLEGQLAHHVQRAREGVRDLEDRQREVAAASRAAATELINSGLTGADAAVVLGVSPQRVSQLVKGSARAT